MASDSEGLRLFLDTTRGLCARAFVENGFRFGRVTTPVGPVNILSFLVENGFRFGRVTTSAGFPLTFRSCPSKMASDSEGLRQGHCPVGHLFISRKWLPIRKGYDSTFRSGLAGRFYVESKMASDSEGLRHCAVLTTPFRRLCRKWLPIRKGYDPPSTL